MADDKSITTNAGDRSQALREDTRSSERYLRPAVDIVETEDGLIIAADLPGVSKEHLDINIDKGLLTIRAANDQVVRGNEIYREFELLSFYRQFQLPDAIDQEKVRAEFNGGVLTLWLVKSERARPRRIEIRGS